MKIRKRESGQQKKCKQKRERSQKLFIIKSKKKTITIFFSKRNKIFGKNIKIINCFQKRCIILQFLLKNSHSDRCWKKQQKIPFRKTFYLKLVQIHRASFTKQFVFCLFFFFTLYTKIPIECRVCGCTHCQGKSFFLFFYK